VKNVSAVVFTFVIAFFGASSQAQLTFNFLNSTGNAQADAGFQLAADYWSSQFNDPITVNVTRGFTNLGGSTLGQASSSESGYSFVDFRNAVLGDVTSAADAAFSSSLPSGNAFSVWINGTRDGIAPHLDNNGGTNNTSVFLTNANAKALGLIAANQGGSDTSITFNNSSLFNWDFDPSDGIGAGQQDFVGVAIHELGHAMGFTSGVDVLDFNFWDGGLGGFNDDDFVFVSALDFTRHSADSLANGADIDWTADTRAKFYSIDGGATMGGGIAAGDDHWSTGVFEGDGNQASHWKDDLLLGNYLGTMDPTANPAGQLNLVTALDLQALDVIGYNVAAIPEPSGLMLVGVVFGCLFRRNRRKRHS
jgi:hypothetical protein